MFTTSQRAQRFASRAAEVNPWIGPCRGRPRRPARRAQRGGLRRGGWARMRLATFLLLDLAGALLMTSLVAGLGYELGQRAVDVVLLLQDF
jgi:hypothetical protein